MAWSRPLTHARHLLLATCYSPHCPRTHQVQLWLEFDAFLRAIATRTGKQMPEH